MYILVLMLFVWIMGMFTIDVCAQAVDSGICGENLEWSLDSEGTLTISGTGIMTDYTNYNFAPWYKYCFFVKKVMIENGVTCIASFAFYNYQNLTSLTVGASVENVGSNAFRYCYRLAEVINKSSLDICAGNDDFGYIGAYAIEVHTGESKLVQQGDYLFYSLGAGYLVNYLGSEAELALPTDCNGSSAYTIWHYAFYANTDITSVIIPQGVTTVGKYAFAYCEKLKSVTMGEGLAVVSDFAFAYSSKLTSVTFAKGQSLSIGSHAFYDCDGLVSIDLPACTSSVGSSAFYGCGSLEHISIGDAATGIGSEAFRYCSKLKSIKIGSNITSIGSSAFEGCTSLKIVYIHSPIVAATLISLNACGDLIAYAETVLIEKSIANLDTAELVKFSFIEELNYEGIEYVSYSSHAHIWQDYSEERVPCEQAGFEGVKCIECSLVKGNSVPMHNFIAYAGHGANSHWDVCEDCGEIANQTAHTPSRTAPTCTDAIICELCLRTIEAALNHDHSAEYTVDLEPTCTEKGSKSRHCIRCTDKIDVTAISPSGHSFADWYETKAPTCATAGIMERKCSICQNKETGTVPVLDHTPASAVEENRTNATCVADGSYDSVVYCAVCASEISRESKTLVKLNHDYSLEWTVDLAPTCTEKGSKSHHCTRCAEKTDVTEIPKAEHTPLDAVEENRVNASCTEDGSYDSVIYCSACSAELSRESKTLVKLGHDYGTEWTVDLAPTCTEEGSKSHHCSRCEEKADVTGIAKSAHTYGDIWHFDGEHHFKECACGDTFAQAHTWNAGEVTKQATKEAEGETTYTCTVCAKTKTESIPKLPSLSTIAIVGIAAGSTVAVSAGAFSLFWFVIKKKRWVDLIKVFKK